ncbi:MAG: ATP-binding protein [Candidatus Gastranaerophilales bacterium]|nr:ATP-binding protein [Candidatus Gastranaerophilales bacterium]
MVNPISNYSSNTTLAPLAKPQKQEDKAKNDYFSDSFESSTETKKPKQGSFWDKNLAAIVGISSLAIVGITIANAMRSKSRVETVIKTIEKNGNQFRGDDVQNGLGPKLTYRNVFENYKNNDSVATLSELPGMKEAKKSFVRNILNPIKHEDLYKANDVPTLNAAILHGPPGTGKTNLVRVLAKELDADVATFAVHKDGSPFVNQGAINLKNRADFVKNAAINNPDKQYIAFFDEIEGMLTEDKSGSNPSRQELIKTVLITLDEFKQIPNLRVLATTNEELNHGTGFFKNMNEPAMDRFPLKIFIDNPDKEAVVGAVKYHLRKSKDAGDLAKNNEAIDRISDNLLGYSHRNIEQISADAKRFLVEEQSIAREAGKATKIPLEERHFIKAIEEFKKSKDVTKPAQAVEQRPQSFLDLLDNDFLKGLSDSIKESMETLANILKKMPGMEHLAGDIDDVAKAAPKKAPKAPKIELSSKEEFEKLMTEKGNKLKELEDLIKSPISEKERNLHRTEQANIAQELDNIFEEYAKKFGSGKNPQPPTPSAN